MRHRRKFINKKNATVFKLVPRDEGSDSHDLEKLGLKVKEDDEAKKKRIEEQIKYGVYYEDDYNYLQHLRERKPVSTLVPADELPELAQSVREFNHSLRDDLSCSEEIFSTVIYDTHMMSTKPAPEKVAPEFWDPDLEEALEHPASEEELEDDFILMANQGNNENQEDMDEGSFDGDLEEGEYEEDMEDDEEGESDKKADLLSCNYDDLALEKLVQKMQESDSTKPSSAQPSNPISDSEGFVRLLVKERDVCLESPQLTEELKQRTLELLSAEEEPRLVVREVEQPVRKSDTQPIWPPSRPPTRASSLSFKPTIIDAPPSKPIQKIQLEGRMGIPSSRVAVTLGRLREMEGVKDPRQLNDSVAESVALRLARDLTLTRSQGETPEERRQRKAQVKLYNKERRMEKKANRLAFKQEEVKQKRQAQQAALQGRVIKLP